MFGEEAQLTSSGIGSRSPTRADRTLHASAIDHHWIDRHRVDNLGQSDLFPSSRAIGYGPSRPCLCIQWRAGTIRSLRGRSPPADAYSPLLQRNGKTIGVPFLVTEDYRQALRHRVVLAYPTISGRTLSQEALKALAAFPRNGGTLIGVNVLGGGLNEVFGFREVQVSP